MQFSAEVQCARFSATLRATPPKCVLASTGLDVPFTSGVQALNLRSMAAPPMQNILLDIEIIESSGYKHQLNQFDQQCDLSLLPARYWHRHSWEASGYCRAHKA